MNIILKVPPDKISFMYFLEEENAIIDYSPRSDDGWNITCPNEAWVKWLNSRKEPNP